MPLRYGGELLGPARFDHISQCATEVARKFKDQEELLELKTLLESLDDILANLREEYKQLSTESKSSSQITTSTTESPPAIPIPTTRRPDYNLLDVAKAKRLVRAREGSISSVKALIAKLRSTESSGQPEGDAATAC